MSNALTVYAWDILQNELEEKIISNRYDIINFLWFQEYELSLTPSSVEFINQNRIKCNVLTCLTDVSDLVDNLDRIGIDSSLYHTEVWPSYWFLNSHFLMLNYENELYKKVNDNSYKFIFRHPFLTFNGRTREHRTLLIEQIIKRNYLNEGVVTYHLESGQTTNELVSNKKDVLKIADQYQTNGNAFIFDEKYMQSFLHIPTETTVDYHLISEKTAMPILCKKPFLTLGPVGYHKRLEQLGFQLYTEIFDYSFDAEPDLDLRVEKLLKNVDLVVKNKNNLNVYYLAIKKKIEHNRQLALNLFRSFNSLPNLIKNRLEDLSKQPTIANGFDSELIKYTTLLTDNKFGFSNISVRPERLYYDLWNNFSFEKIIADLKFSNPKTIVILGENEWLPWFTNEFVYQLNQRDTSLTYVTSAPYSKFIEDQFIEAGIKNYKIEHWPTFWFNYSEKALQVDPATYKVNTAFKYPFISLNNRGHWHRCQFIEEMAKQDMLDKGIVTWHNFLHESKNFEFVHFDNQVRKLDDEFDVKLDSFLLPKEWHESFFHCVVEAGYESIIISEKTALPIMLKKPFFVLGAAGFHKFLVELGFVLYDEFIDYSFDAETDLPKRTEMFVNNLHRLYNITNLENAYKTIEQKIEHNYRNFLRLRSDKNLLPRTVKNIIDSTPEQEFFELSEEQEKYKSLFQHRLK